MWAVYIFVLNLLLFEIFQLVTRASFQYNDNIFSAVEIPIIKIQWLWDHHMDGLAQDCCNSIANTLELQ